MLENNLIYFQLQGWHSENIKEEEIMRELQFSGFLKKCTHSFLLFLSNTKFIAKS